jgi:hypothetical protein
VIVVGDTDLPAGPRRWVPAALGLTAVLQNGWLAEFVLPTRLSPVRSLTSELEADRTPFTDVFRAMFTTADILLGVIGLAMLITLISSAVPARTTASAGQTGPGESTEPAGQPRQLVRRLRLTWLGVAGYGLLGLFDDLSPMSCAPSRDPGCQAAELLRQTHWSDRIHSFGSILAVLAVLASMLALSTTGRWLGQLARTARVFLIADLIVTSGLGLCILLNAPMGIPGRVELLVEGGYLLVLAGYVYAGRRAPTNCMNPCTS